MGKKISYESKIKSGSLLDYPELDYKRKPEPTDFDEE